MLLSLPPLRLAAAQHRRPCMHHELSSTVQVLAKLVLKQYETVDAMVASAAAAVLVSLRPFQAYGAPEKSCLVPRQAVVECTDCSLVLLIRS